MLRRQSNGQILNYASQTPVGTGGEARIFPIREDPDLVAKVYKKPTAQHALKLAAMIANPPVDPMAAKGHVSIAWPVDLVETPTGPGGFVGFLMPRVTGMLPIIDYYNPRTRQRQCPLFHYQYLHRAARNLAAAVGALHARGYVIGDVNETNILVNDSALVTLVDTDSFQVRDPNSGHLFRCPVGTPLFTPPELQNKSFAQIDRGPEHDLFGLAVLIFQILVEGTHPFAGQFTGRGETPPVEVRISLGHFPHGKRARVPYRPARNALPFGVLDPALQQLFVRTLIDGHGNPQARASAKEWLSSLEAAENALTKCSLNDQHRHGSHLGTCPWCERTQQLGGRDPFPSPLAPRHRRRQHPIPMTQSPLPPAAQQRAIAATFVQGAMRWATRVALPVLRSFARRHPLLAAVGLLLGFLTLLSTIREFRRTPSAFANDSPVAGPAAVVVPPVVPVVEIIPPATGQPSRDINPARSLSARAVAKDNDTRKTDETGGARSVVINVIEKPRLNKKTFDPAPGKSISSRNATALGASASTSAVRDTPSDSPGSATTTPLKSKTTLQVSLEQAELAISAAMPGTTEKSPYATHQVLRWGSRSPGGTFQLECGKPFRIVASIESAAAKNLGGAVTFQLAESVKSHHVQGNGQAQCSFGPVSAGIHHLDIRYGGDELHESVSTDVTLIVKDAESLAREEYDEGVKAYEKEDYQHAIKKFRGAIGRLPNGFAQANMKLAEALFQSGMISLKEFLKDARKIGALNNAISEFSDAVDRNDNLAQAWLHLGVAFAMRAETGDEAKAMNALSEAIDHDPTCAAAYNERASLCHKNRDYENAIANMKKVVEYDRENPQAWLHFGRIHHDNQDFQDSINECTEAINRFERNWDLAQAYLLRGSSYFAMFQKERARLRDQALWHNRSMVDLVAQAIKDLEQAVWCVTKIDQAQEREFAARRRNLTEQASGLRIFIREQTGM